jgi:GNAT superfamily N-acetyltransferase
LSARVVIEAFSDGHLRAAGELLARRHARDRARESALPERYGAPGVAGEVLGELWDTPGAVGVVAWRGDELVGYAIGAPANFAPDDPTSAFFRPGAVLMRYTGHAVDQEADAGVYRTLYGALAGQWAADGRFTHYVQVAARDRDALDAWAMLGFGRDLGIAIRDTSPLRDITTPADLRIRRGGPPDLESVAALAIDLARYEAGPPIFFPYLPEYEPEVRREHEIALADPHQVYWLAERAGRVIGMVVLRPPPAHISPLLTPPATLNLAAGAVLTTERASGIGTALLQHALAWACAQGIVYLRLNWMTANPLSTRFWLGHGFRPVMYRLCRVMDGRG